MSSKLVIIPLVIMFLLALVNNTNVFNDSDIGIGFEVTRTVSNVTLTNITTNTEIIWDSTYNIFPWVHRSSFNLVMTSLLNTKFGISEGHDEQSNDIFDARDTKGSPLIESEVYEIIKYDPNLVAELEELQGYGLNLGSSSFIFVGLFLGAIGIVAVLGLRLFGSGISETSISVMFTLIVLFLLWSLLSALTFSLFEDVPLGIGIILYTVLSFMYAIGGFTTTFSAGE